MESESTERKPKERERLVRGGEAAGRVQEREELEEGEEGEELQERGLRGVHGGLGVALERALRRFGAGAKLAAKAGKGLLPV